MEFGDGYATIPSNISSNIFIQAASDNGDYGQENNSQHVTNTVVYTNKCSHLLMYFFRLCLKIIGSVVFFNSVLLFSSVCIP